MIAQRIDNYVLILINNDSIPLKHSLFSTHLTSSMGRSWSCGKEQDRIPIRNGVGEHTMSIIDAGRTGM